MLLKIEIILLFVSCLYIIYFTLDRLGSFLWWKHQRKLRKYARAWESEQYGETDIKTPESDIQEEDVSASSDTKHTARIREIIKRCEVHISRNSIELAKNLIVQGLSLDKNHTKLNLLLADVYEKQEKYQNAEYIYRDMLDESPDDTYILWRLGNIYYIRGKIEKSLSCYQRALKKDKNNIEILDILAHLLAEHWDYDACVTTACAFLKQKPRDGEKLSLKWYALEKLWKPSEALTNYRLVLEVDPYNKEILSRVKKLES